MPSFRDPLTRRDSRDPRDVLKAAGLTAPNIEARWKPYLSLDSAIIVGRARRAMDALRQRVDSARVLFDHGSSVIADDDATLRGLSLTILQLLDTATATGSSVHIALVGRTDPTGTDETNQSLAQQRVDAVVLGVPASVLQGKSLATSQPLRGTDPGEGARINRSVSFEVQVAGGSRAPRGP